MGGEKSVSEGGEGRERRKKYTRTQTEGGWLVLWDGGLVVGVEGVNWIHPLPTSPLRNVLQQDIGNTVVEMQ